MVYILARQYNKHPEICATNERHPDAHWKYRMNGLPVPTSLLPKSITVSSESPMPDLMEWGKSHFIISPAMRQCLEELVPGLVEYLPIEVNGPPHMHLAPSYFYINVLERAQMVDWSRTTPDNEGWERDKQGRPVIFAPLPTRPGRVAFRKTPELYIWHEIDTEDASNVYSFYNDFHLLSDELWRQIDRTFPDTIDPRRFPD